MWPELVQHGQCGRDARLPYVVPIVLRDESEGGSRPVIIVNDQYAAVKQGFLM